MRRHSSRFRWLRLAIFWLGLPVLALAAAIWITLPDENERLSLPGLSAPVTITMDNAGVPRIQAATETDAAMAMGWLHARDRMFQMELMRRTGQGRLSELLGEGGLRLDRFMRTVALGDRAEADLPGLSLATRTLLEAYAAGVNARIAQRGRFIAPEFLWFGTPEPWRPADSLIWGKLMGLWLSGNWRTEIERADWLQRIGARRLWELVAPDATSGEPDRQAAALPGLGSLLAALPQFPREIPHPDSASNAWALDAARSGTGGALLASDPHLGFSAPILWYLARVELPGGRFRGGATAPGVPMFVIGRNESLAWGFTTTHADTQDVFVERVVDDLRYETEAGPRPFLTRRELIRVRGGDPVSITVRETRHGPVMSDLDEIPRRDGRVLAVAMANLAPGDRTADALARLNAARGVEDAGQAAALFMSPSQNLMVADRAGAIGMFVTGRIPRRRMGDGALPMPGHDGLADWDGFHPPETMPRNIAPASGRLVNANNRPAPPDQGVFLARDFPDDSRFRRIHELLDGTRRPDAAVMAGIQLDTTSVLARASLPLLRGLSLTGPAAIAQDMLKAWEGDMATPLPQPLIWNAWSRHFLTLVLLEAEAPVEAATPELLARILSGDAAFLCRPSCADQAGRALATTMTELSATYGRDPGAWRWGDAHQALLEHPVLRVIPGISWLMRLTVPTGGDGNTVSRGGMRALPGLPFAHVHGAGLRLVADMATSDGLYAIIATGQSGHPFSRHWADLLHRWRDGEMLRLGRQPSRVSSRIDLTP